MAAQLKICDKCFKKLSCISQSRRFLTSSSRGPSSKDVRNSFVDFFCKQNDHTFVKSSSVIPGKDQGTYFTNAGMNQFKPLFMNRLSLERSTYKTVSNSQKCVRVGGKHNDLADVGTDLTHHTFFEMLGSWSFGDYFKNEAVAMAVELLHKVYGLPTDRLYYTIFEGDFNTYKAWRKAGIPRSRILTFGEKDNFWDMGETGPCGPCTEIHYDHVGGRDASSLVNTGSPEVVEIWNLVFMQYHRTNKGTMLPLPQRHVDTGMGLERICAVLQGTKSNYSTDLFLPLFDMIQKEAGVQAYTDQTGNHPNSRLDTAYRIVADHTRMATVCISDGLLPGRELLEQKLKTVIYRALYQCHKVLESPEGLMAKLVDPIVESLGEAYPELDENSKKVKEVLAETEQRYLQSERDGQKNFRKLLKAVPSVQVLEGEQIKKLFTGHYGDNMSLDMIELVARSYGVAVDEEAMAAIAEENKVFPTAEVEFPWLTKDLVKALSLRNIPATDDSHKYRYDKSGDTYVFGELKGRILCVLDEDNSVVTDLSSEQKVGLILDQTQFYAELGGQAGDIGTIQTETGTVHITDTQTSDDYVLHIGTVTEGSVVEDQEATMTIDAEHRLGCMRNHTCTHLLAAALRKIVAKDMTQQGSAIGPTKFTFDYSCHVKKENNRVQRVEEAVKAMIRAELPVKRTLTPLQEAKEDPDVVYLDNVEYPNDVYVVSLSQPSDLSEDTIRSSELCGGTHVFNTGDIGDFCVTNLTGALSSTKHITCLTGEHAQKALENGRELEKLYNKLVVTVKIGTSLEGCISQQKQIFKMLGEKVLPKGVHDRVFQEMDYIGNSINEMVGKMSVASLNQELDAKLRGPEDYVVHFTTAKSLKKVMKSVMPIRYKKPCILVVKTNNSTSAIIFLPKHWEDNRGDAVRMFLKATDGKISFFKEGEYTVVSDVKDKTEVFMEAARTTLSTYVKNRTKTAAS